METNQDLMGIQLRDARGVQSREHGSRIEPSERVDKAGGSDSSQGRGEKDL